MSAMVHIAGVHVQVGSQLRQRCGWCGATLIDYDLERLAVPEGQAAGPATWPAGELVRVDGPLSILMEHVDGADLPVDACARLDHAVTR